MIPVTSCSPSCSDGRNGIIQFNPPAGTDMKMEEDDDDVSAVGSVLHCITAMKDYVNKSLEEMRVEYYAASREGLQRRMSGFGTTGQTAGLFGQPASLNSTSSSDSPMDFKYIGTTCTTALSTKPSGTMTRFSPRTGVETKEKIVTDIVVDTRLQCITCMEEYADKSLEELRFEDYVANRKGPQPKMDGSGTARLPETFDFFSSHDSPHATSISKELTGHSRIKCVGQGAKMYVDAACSTDFLSYVKWCKNWDERDVSSLVRPDIGCGDISNNDGFSAGRRRVKPTATRNLFLIRHGQYVNSNTDDKRLTSLGCFQAELTGKRLKDLDFKYTNIIHSTQQRAEETASIIHKFLPDVPRWGTELLCEGTAIAPEPPLSRFKESRFYHQDRTRIDEAFKIHFHRADPVQKIDSYDILVCHANVIRYLICRYDHGYWSKELSVLIPPPAALHCITRSSTTRHPYCVQLTKCRTDRFANAFIPEHIQTLEFLSRALQFPPEAWSRFGLRHSSITHLSISPSGIVCLHYYGDCGHMPVDKLTTT